MTVTIRAMTTSYWYVDADRAPIDWDTAVVDGVATVRIFRLERFTTQGGSSEELRTLFAPVGGIISPAALEAAQAQESTDAVPAPFVPYVGPSGGGGGGGGGDGSPVTWSSITGKPTSFPPTLGTTSSTAAAGNDTRLTNQRVPTNDSVTDDKVAAGAGISLDKTADGAGRVAFTPAERSALAAVPDALDTLGDSVDQVTTAVAAKADQSAVTTALAAKADQSAVTTALAGKADQSAVTTALAGKASTAQLDAKANTADLGAKVIILTVGEAVPAGTPAGSLIVRH